MSRTPRLVASLSLVALACGGSSSPTPVDAGADAAVDAGALADMTRGGPQSKIEHLVVIVQENHTFDSYFGRYCTAATGSSPTCNTGPACCEAGPATVGGAMPVVLDDHENANVYPDHSQACELEEIDGGKMDRFVAGATVAGCSQPENFAYAPATVVQPYRDLAAQYALADRWFQPAAGESSMNDMYLARAKFVFLDNDVEPDALGKACSTNTDVKSYTDPTIADLLVAAGVSWAWYGGGYAAMKAADAAKAGSCPTPPAGCLLQEPIYPCVYDPSDVPFAYYPSVKDNPLYFRDGDALATDLASGQLPSVSFVKAIGYKSEHPGEYMTISDGAAFVRGVVDAVAASPLASSTLVLVTWDEGGGFYDHVAPPAASTVDNTPYGTRVPLLAIGPFARKNFVSHVVMEHSSIVKFIEWNWLGGKTGQLGTRDAVVANLGSLLDPAATGTPVPEQ